MKFLPLTNDSRFTVIDDEDYEICSSYRWHLNKRYIRTIVKNRPIYLSLLVMFQGGPRKLYVDHIDGDPLNNRRSNLRVATNSQNQANRKRLTTNTSGYRGVTWHRCAEKWQASIKVNGMSKHLGLFVDARMAAEAYDKAAVEYFGQFSNPNFISAAA